MGVFWAFVLAAVVVVVPEIPRAGGVDGFSAAPAVDFACCDFGCPGFASALVGPAVAAFFVGALAGHEGLEEGAEGGVVHATDSR